MQEKEYFREGLAEMRRVAEGKYNHITVADILSCFPDRQLTRHEIGLIYQYAKEEHIIIEDYRPHDTRSVPLGKPKLTGEEKAYFQMYLSDLAKIPACSEDEEEMLLSRLADGDETVINRLVEGHLRQVLQMARNHAGRGVPIGDLVQEGNMELLLAAQDIVSGSAQILQGGFREYADTRVQRAMRAMIREQAGHDRAGERMAHETNALLAATMELEEELGREATLAELARKVSLPEDKVEELVRISLNAAAYGDRAEEQEDRSR